MDTGVGNMCTLLNSIDRWETKTGEEGGESHKCTSTGRRLSEAGSGRRAGQVLCARSTVRHHPGALPTGLAF